MSRMIAFLLAAIVFTGCATEEPETPKKDYARELRPGESALELVTDRSLYPDFRAMWNQRAQAREAYVKGLEWFDKPSSRTFYPFEVFTHEKVRRSLARLVEIIDGAASPQEFAGRIALEFDVYRSVGWDGSGTVLFTAYYQPIFDGRVRPDSVYRYPLYRLPGDLVKADDGTPLGRRVGEKVVSYPTRREIEEGHLLEGKRLELVWLKSALDAFIIHVQGSAKIRLEDGRFLYVGYAGKTDRPYRSLGKALVEDGRFPEEDLSLPRIRRYFSQHPEELREYLWKNESYVFFTETGPGGPWGSLGVPVTPFATLATDKSIFPRGAPTAVETLLPAPSEGGVAPRPFVALTADQDTGGAIRSPGRCDIFVGIGDEAERIAGRTKYEGRLFYLLLKGDEEEASIGDPALGLGGSRP